MGKVWEGDACIDRVYPFEAANYWFNELKVLHNVYDAQACARECDANPECQAATFGDESAGREANTCTLRTKAENRHTGQAGLRTWVK
jgi:hypothetical protein